jgi:hypothetical protein
LRWCKLRRYRAIAAAMKYKILLQPQNFCTLHRYVGRYFYKAVRQMQKSASLRSYFRDRCCNAFLQPRRKRILVCVNLVGYGTLASGKLLQQMARNIQWHWNFPKAKVRVQDQWYRMEFQVEAVCFSTLPPSVVHNNRDQKNLFSRIESEVESMGVSLMDGVASNTGFFLVTNVGYKGASTEAHEFGHGLGLWPNTPTAHPEDLDQRGQGRPGLMYPRGTIVDPKFQYNAKAPAGEPGGTVHPDTRRVRQKDIDVLMTTVRIGKHTRYWRFGKLTNLYHQKVYGT